MAEETPRNVPAESDQVPGDEQPASAEDWFDVLREVAGEDLLPAKLGRRMWGVGWRVMKYCPKTSR